MSYAYSVVIRNGINSEHVWCGHHHATTDAAKASRKLHVDVDYLYAPTVLSVVSEREEVNV